MRLQQIVEKLHVELVVLHDQDGLGHPGLPSSPLPHRPGAQCDRPQRPQASRSRRFPMVRLATIPYGMGNIKPWPELFASTGERQKTWQFRRLPIWRASRNGSDVSLRSPAWDRKRFAPPPTIRSSWPVFWIVSPATKPSSPPSPTTSKWGRNT